MDLFIITPYALGKSFVYNLFMNVTKSSGCEHFDFVNKVIDKVIDSFWGVMNRKKTSRVTMLNINCPHFGTCSGCKLDTDVASLPIFVEAQKFFLDFGFNQFSLQAGNPTHWRCRAKLAVRGDSSSPSIGLFEEGTHSVVDIPDCKVHHPAINRAVEVVRAWIIKNQIRLYQESNGQGILRYLQFVVERSTGRVQAVFVVNLREDDTQSKALLVRLLSHLWEGLPDLWHSIWINFNPTIKNAIFSPRWTFLFGEKWLEEAVCGVKISLHPGSFFQANIEMFEKLLLRLRDFVPQGTSLIEYYAGCGAIGLSLVELCRQITFVEIVPLAKESFEETKKTLSQSMTERLNYLCKDSQAAVGLLLKQPDLVIVDPPRKGLDSLLLKALCNTQHPFRLIYISCGWESFTRDCARLLSNGWSLVHAEAFLFFPGSDHLEVLAVFER